MKKELLVAPSNEVKPSPDLSGSHFVRDLSGNKGGSPIMSHKWEKQKNLIFSRKKLYQLKYLIFYKPYQLKYLIFYKVHFIF